VTAGSLFISA